jgi:hypothetical protein
MTSLKGAELGSMMKQRQTGWANDNKRFMKSSLATLTTLFFASAQHPVDFVIVST